tara:strand:- start:276 stop:401 length:126 start_codon:yes stop_codon:yes gene_type:complete
MTEWRSARNFSGAPKWPDAQGINVAGLQVVTDNAPARALYR